MNVLVTGAAGFIGSHVAEALKKEGHSVTGVDNFSDYYDPSLKRQNAELLQRAAIPVLKFDLADDDFYREVLFDFDYVFHFAAQPGISSAVTFDQYFRNNVIVTQKLLSRSVESRSLKLFVNISTSSVYGVDATGSEQTEPKPVSDYGVTKLAAEQLVLSAARRGKIKACSLRLFSVYGPRERPDKLYSKLITALCENKPFPLFTGSDRHVRSYTYVEDIVRGIISVIGNEDKVNREIFNIGTDREHTTREGIVIVERLLNKTADILPQPPRAGDQLTTKANIKKAREVLQYNPQVTLEAGLKKQVASITSKFEL